MLRVNYYCKLLFVLLSWNLHFLTTLWTRRSRSTSCTCLAFITTPKKAFPSPSLRSHRTITTQIHFAMKNIIILPMDPLTNFANSFAAANGIQVQKKDAPGSYVGAPISLLPNAFPAVAFDNAKALAPYFNILVDRISRDGTFLKETLGGEHGVVSKDLYTKKLLEMYENIYMTSSSSAASSLDPKLHPEDGNKRQCNFAKDADRLGILRSDYMLSPVDHGDRYDIFQVELNTIASSFAGLACHVANMHRTMTERFHFELEDWLYANQVAVMGQNYQAPPTFIPGVPENPASFKLPHAMNVAHERYMNRFKPSLPVVILFIVQEGETNTVDQRILEFHLWDQHKVPVIRMSLTKAKTLLHMDSETGALYILPSDENDASASYDGENRRAMISPKYEVSVAYFRAGYAPTDYPDGYEGIEWDSRECIERSRATKCPALGYHLAGTKKVQQQLARPGVLEKFFTEEEIANGIATRMRSAFAGLYSLGSDAVQDDLEAVKEAISGKDGNYVLKPQREGGGYNYYGEQLAEKLKANVELVMEDGIEKVKLGDDLAEFILMQRLFPPKQTAILLRSGAVEGMNESISELGCFGTIVQSHDGQETFHNEYSGFLLRTKFSNVNEGGVASGFATLSSPYLC